jgi:hypothetical protein
LHFELDAAGERGSRIQQLLGSIERGDDPLDDLAPLPSPSAPRQTGEGS